MKVADSAFSSKDETETSELSYDSPLSNMNASTECPAVIPLNVAFPPHKNAEGSEVDFDLERAVKSTPCQDCSPTSPISISDVCSAEEDREQTFSDDCDEEGSSEYDSEDDETTDNSAWSRTGLEYTFWAQTSFIDHQGYLNLYQMSPGTLACCNWGWYPDYNYPPPRPKGSRAPLLVLTNDEGDHYYIHDPFELDGTYATSDKYLDESTAAQKATANPSQAQTPPGNHMDQTSNEDTVNQAMTPIQATSLDADDTYGGYSFNASAGIIFAWLQLTPNVSYTPDIQAGNGPSGHDSDYNYDGESDTDSYSVHYTTWTGLEFTPWATHSYIDPDGHMDLYSLRQVREADLYAHGALPTCDWWHWEDPDQHPSCKGPCLVLSTPEGDEFELDDPKEYDGSYGGKQASEICHETDDGADGGSETGYAFDAAKGIMWADDEAEDDYWERVEGQGEEWWG
ncbi:hypothetical protein QBC41DRAFT_394509 [Cercophora samala]|uniref:Uncharacterized protein n=1 Tax=Cercophora samala TaxID=330535 RepID=A0AA39ZCB9_9PEZI|nr:hypothetical protein QBC41DRAFT_394509 [Cercophora samala]